MVVVYLLLGLCFLHHVMYSVDDFHRSLPFLCARPSNVRPGGGLWPEPGPSRYASIKQLLVLGQGGLLGQGEGFAQNFSLHGSDPASITPLL